MKDDEASVLSSEFKLWGVKFERRQTDGGHIEFKWQVSPDKEPRSFYTSKTPSDWRGALNARAVVRRMFRADGLNLKETITKPKPVLHKALETPQPVETDACQIKMLRSEVSDLTDMMLDLASTVALLKGHLMPNLTERIAELAEQRELVLPVDHDRRGMFEPPPIKEPLAGLVEGHDLRGMVATEPLFKAKQVPAELPSIAVSQQEKNRSARTMAARRVKTIEYVNHHWATTDEIAKAMGLKKPVTYMKLYYLSKQGVIEQFRDQWRKKPNGKSNGHHREARP